MDLSFVSNLFMDFVYFYWLNYFYICGGYILFIVYVYEFCCVFVSFVDDCLFFVGEVMSLRLCLIVFIVIEIGICVVDEVCCVVGIFFFVKF